MVGLKASDRFLGVLLSAPLLKKADNISNFTILMARCVRLFAPHFGILALDPAGVSRDPKVVRDYENDPLIYHGKITSSLGVELLQVVNYFKDNLNKVEFPFLVLQGTDDVLVNPQGAEDLYNQSTSKDKEIRIYSRLYHEIFNEPERHEIFGDVVRW
eukprot:CAMPEP_0174259386 /NCGR_PEP_ID=MMETSP0439-20130205/8209_1 /TAXON_ID=0 /ORGANISM="Stereomyxa ramosa, Strain Chinc5" /LENGTH=157 /DNA_ID=CAMNT_0015343247 /DNA_START=283 /DNA_END=753 /DNA_ORIENTATION=+